MLLKLNSVPQLCLFTHGYGKYVGLATRWLSPNPGNCGLKNTSRNPNFKRRLAVFEVGHVGVYGPQWVVWAFVQAPERYVHIVCVCVWEVDGEERGVPADAVSHLLDKSLICVTQRGIMGFWEEESGTLNAPFKPDTLCWILSSTMEGFVLNTSYLICTIIEQDHKNSNEKTINSSHVHVRQLDSEFWLISKWETFFTCGLIRPSGVSLLVFQNSRAEADPLWFPGLVCRGCVFQPSG